LARFDAPRHPARLFGCGFLAQGTLKFRVGSSVFRVGAARIGLRILRARATLRAPVCRRNFAANTPRIREIVSNLNPEALDADPLETREWMESLDAVISHAGPQRARYVVQRLVEQAWRRGVTPELPVNTPYINTISTADEPDFPGDAAIEKRIRRLVRWNAMAMVQRANKKFSGIGGHLSTYASSASLYEVGFNHFFRGPNAEGGGDLIYYQGHAAPGIYSRAFVEGRLEAEQLDHFRREAAQPGLSSYPHPRLMPEFWQFPTVSMGIGPISAIYQARFNRYLHNRGLKDTSGSRIWAFLGDGECDEPESLGALHVAAREELDNLVFVINCNLQRLDGPVRGNGKIIQELEAVFRGSGWNVIKVIWAPEWDELLTKDTDGLLKRRMAEVVDGQFQKYTTSSGEYIRQHFFGTDPRLLEIVSHLSDEQLQKLRRGGHSYRKVYSAYHRALKANGKPTVILAHTVKGWTLGPAFEGSNIAHQKKAMDLGDLKTFRDLLELPVPDDKLEEAPFYRPDPKSEEIQYLLERRRQLGGVIPVRRTKATVAVEYPAPEFYAEYHKGMEKGEASTTMVFARLLSKLMRDKKVGKHIVPIVPDEARTFGMDALFSSAGIYSAKGQLYEPVDKGRVLYYREARDGQVLEEGITEAGSMASFVAAATSYSTNGVPMIPFYIFYSMFGFQRTGDQMWACMDQQGRGFVLGATAGRTTLNGEGLQHEDGHSHVLAATYPSVLAYDIAFAFELAVVIEDGIRRMYQENENIWYYITLQNEDYKMPAMPEGSKEGILKGLYRFQSAEKKKKLHVQLLGSSCIMLQVLRAVELLEKHGVSADVWGVTSYQQLRREALECERFNRLHPEAEPRIPYVTKTLADSEGPFIAVSDYMVLNQDQIARWVPRRYVPLGADGVGMSDTREALRRHFEIDAECVVIGALDALKLEGKMTGKAVAKAIAELGVDPNKRYSAHV
jgi:pyruvate dehydrogenase E1 component